MASGTTTVWGRPYPLSTDAPNVHTDIQALANSLETVPLYPTTATSSRTGVAGESVVVSPSQTLTLPASPAKGDTIQIIALGTVTGATPATVSTAGGKVVNGVGLSSASSFVLGTPNAMAKVQYDGTAWRMIEGQQDTGWVAVTLGTNVTALTGGFYVPSARKVGDTCLLKGAMDSTGAISSGATVFTSPFAPTSKAILLMNLNASLISALVGTSGAVTLDGTISGAGSSFGVDGSSYSLV